jgi:MFS family permease
VLLVAAFLWGLGIGTINPILGAVEYERVPRPLQARVLGTVGALAWAEMPMGGLLADWLAGTTSVTAALVVAGACYLAATIIPFVFPAWRGLDRPACTARSPLLAR